MRVTTQPTMMFEAEFRKRVNKTYDNMTARARPRLWKSGKRRGTVRVPGLKALPFFRDELWAHVRAQIPDGGALCQYCKDYGRSTLIYLDTFVLDHHVPVKHGGIEAWKLANLVCVCADCNNIKGSMSYSAFVWVMRDYIPSLDPIDQKYIIACLRTHGQVVRGWGPKEQPKAPPAPKVMQELQRRLEDDF